MRRSRAVLFGLAAASFAVTTVAWAVTGTIAWFGVTTAVAFAAVGVATPWLAHQEENAPLCRSCQAPVRSASYGFCLHCGIMRPLKDSKAANATK